MEIITDKDKDELHIANCKIQKIIRKYGIEKIVFRNGEMDIELKQTQNNDSGEKNEKTIKKRSIM